MLRRDANSLFLSYHLSPQKCQPLVLGPSDCIKPPIAWQKDTGQ